MNYKDEIRLRAEARGIQYLVHFTQIQNLEGIVKHGLLPRAEIERRGLDALGTDPWRLDGDHEATSLSISNINRDMFEAKRRERPQAVWMVLYFEPKVLWTHDCRFCFRNAAHNDLSKCRKCRRGPWGFDTMFEDEAPVFMFKGQSYRKETGIPLHCPTRVDAEVQVRGRIAPELIMGACIDRPDLTDYVRAHIEGLNKEPGDDRNVLVENL
jgi:hypothetical protein